LSAITIPLQQSEARIARRETLRELGRSKTFIAGALIVGFWVFWGIVGSRLTPLDPLAQGDTILARPGPGHWMGTDTLGRDVLSRVLAGATGVLKIAPLATLLGVVGGTILGLVTGYFRGFVDEALGRLIDALLALPLIVIAVTAIVALGASNTTLVIVIGVIFTPLVARTVRAAVLAERDLDYVPAARLRGEHAPYIMFVEILPNARGPLIVDMCLRTGYNVVIIGVLGFLGIGLPPPDPDWGGMVKDTYGFMTVWPHMAIVPCAAISSLVIGFNLLAVGLREIGQRD